MEKIDLFEKDLKDIGVNVNEIKKALLGDFENAGLITKVVDIEKRLSECECFIGNVKKQFTNIAWKAIALGMGSAGGGAVLSKYIETLIK